MKLYHMQLASVSSVYTINITSSIINCLEMRISFWFLWIPISSILSHAYSQCLKDQQSLLLAFRNDLTSSVNIAGWNQSVDCCEWNGITCDTDGHVIGLDLSNKSLNGVINDSSSLFGLESLQSLNLAYNGFDLSSLPSGFGKLTQLTYLNLSNANFEGQVPIEFSLLTRLVTLDLSSAPPYALNLENPDLGTLIQNLTQLTHLYLDNANIFTHGNNWSWVISSFLPHLQVLSLKTCNLSDPIDSSLVKLKHLSVILLDGNMFFSGIPESFADLKNLTVLSISGCYLNGLLPRKIFQLPTLKTIDLSDNQVLEGPLPEMGAALELQHLVLSGTRIGGRLPDSIGSLRKLSSVQLRGCEFYGPIPESMQNLTLVKDLDLSANRLTGSIPSFQRSKNHLVSVSFSQNNLSGGVPSSHWEGLDKLESLDLASNSLTGSFPESLLTLKSLVSLDLSNNSFSGVINEPVTVSCYQLTTLDLSSNKFEGPIPGSIFKLAALSTLTLSANKFTGMVDFDMLANLKELTKLQLSYNNLTITVSVKSNSSSAFLSLYKLEELFLVSCKMQQIPDLRNQSKLIMLDLSDNQMSGEIPNWIWEAGNGYLRSLNLSHNKFSSLQKPYTFPSMLDVLDLHSNNLEGDIPVPPSGVYILDYSSNNFRSSIPLEFGNALTNTRLFSISNNKLVGPIPQSICNATALQILDLSNNSLNGGLPSCFTNTLIAFNLRGNNLTGNVLDVFPDGCGLQTLDLSGNRLHGPLPPSLVRCKNLMVLDLGHNMITDSFPCWINNLSNLHVFVIRSNRFHGNITCMGSNSNFSSLQIVDIASNVFSGVLPPSLFTSFTGIIDKFNNAESKLSYLYFKHPANSAIYYQDSETINLRGSDRKYEKILNIFASIDFSNNSFQGSIPATLGDLKLLRLVNLSHNALTGPIPVSFGKLTNLETLDLSVNKLSGSIPPQLASISFLSSLNLSYNELSGRIPRGSQFQTFTELSFIGNQGLCGMPLNKSCNVNATSTSPETNEDEIGLYVSIGLGLLVGCMMFVSPLVFLRRWRTWYNLHVDDLLSRIIRTKDDQTRRVSVMKAREDSRAQLIDSNDTG